MATHEQYELAATALKKLAATKVAALPFFYQSIAQNALSDAMMHEFAHAALDAVLPKDTPK